MRGSSFFFFFLRGGEELPLVGKGNNRKPLPLSGSNSYFETVIGDRLGLIFDFVLGADLFSI